MASTDDLHRIFAGVASAPCVGFEARQLVGCAGDEPVIVNAAEPCVQGAEPTVVEVEMDADPRARARVLETVLLQHDAVEHTPSGLWQVQRLRLLPRRMSVPNM